MKRIERLRKKMGGKTLLIENPVDIQYLTGLSVSLGKLLLTEEGASLFVDGRYKGVAAEKVPSLARDLADWKKVASMQSRIAFDSSWTSVDALSSYQEEFPKTEWVALKTPLQDLRVIKEETEVNSLRKAARLTWEGIEHVRSLLVEGIQEKELALAFEIFCKKHGATALSFETIVAFGPNSARPHHRAGDARLRRGDLVLVDAGAVVEGYTGDLTRVFFFGSPDPRLETLLTHVQEASRLAISKAAPGVLAGELDAAVHDLFEKHNVKPLYMHTLGHGLGLEVHEFPRLGMLGKDKQVSLQPGFCFTIEPGLYLEGVGGIRWEEMVHMTPSGPEILSRF